MAFLDKEKRSASVSATEKTEIVSIDFEALAKLLDSSPSLAVKVYRASHPGVATVTVAVSANDSLTNKPAEPKE